jgi:hypothetical protein
MPYVKRYTCLGAMLLLASGVAFAQDKAKGKSIGDSGQVEQTLRNSEKQWVHAQMTKSPDQLAPLVAENFVEIEDDGSMQTKSQVLSGLKNADWEINDVSEMKITVYGNAAVVIGLWTGKRKGKPIGSKERFADTWIKMPDGKWRCVVSAPVPFK